MKVSTEDRFWSKVDKSGGPDACWPWVAARNKAGYGQFSIGGRLARAHRFAYELVHGPIPEGDGFHGTCALHRCDHPPCCNPAHIFLGTQAENIADMDEKGRGNRPRGDRNGSRLHPESRPRGERHRRAKLTETKVAAIRAAYAAGGVSQLDLGVQFGVGQTTISDIVLGKRWGSAK